VAEPLYYLGQLRSLASWSKVGRELVRALLRAGMDVRVIEVADDRPDPSFRLPPELEHAVVDADRPPVGSTVLTFAPPADYAALLGEQRGFGIVVYEADRWPPSWVRAVTDRLRLALVPSRHGCATLIASGVSASGVAFVPHGVDRSVYTAQGRVPAGGSSRLRILFVGTPAWRKGIDLLLAAHSLAFAPNDPVSLVLKVVPYVDLRSRPYLDASYSERALDLRRAGYRVMLHEQAMSEAQMAALYRGADVLCLPFRGECAPLPVLEALACGTPVICTDWSGPREVVDSAVGMLLPVARTIPAGPYLADPDVADAQAQMVEVDVHATARALRRAFEDRDGLATMGACAAQRSAAWTWEAAAATLRDVLAAHGGN
jgi:glycosyltransferase involved in cell wall biosynthesis